MSRLNLILKSAVVLTLVVSTIACETNKRRAQTLTGRSPRGGTFYNQFGQPQAASPGLASTRWGSIYGTDDFSFQTALQGLAMTDVGQVSASGGQTGVFFFGEVPIQGQMAGGFGGMRSGTVAPNSRLRIEIYDSGFYTSGEYVSIDMSQARGQVQAGGNTYVEFSDGYGTVALNGYINGQNFEGQVTYQNSSGGVGILGTFAVPACGFFICN